jgi:DNA-binding NtrC family response regulator
MAHILVVDDETSLRKALKASLQQAGYEVSTAASGDEALAQLQKQEIDLLLSDITMPKLDGLALLRQVKAQAPGLVVVMMSGHADVPTAVEAMQQGAYDYLVKPFSKDAVLGTVHKALTMRALTVANLARKCQGQERFARANVIGSSPAWGRVCDTVQQVALTRATVLLTGESGTGKELLAGLLHSLSPRADRPFITFNAAAMPATLLEAELFGYEKGAFTDAQQRKPGRFELADGGTLFLDEIGDMPLESQAKLLRVLQESTFERLGGTHTLRVDVRIVTATNKDLDQEVAAQRFRRDLYYRLDVIRIHLPPLCERREDIPLLVAHFLRKYARQHGKDIPLIQQQALHHLQTYPWPGNVRELANVIERAVVLAQGPTIGVADLPQHLQDPAVSCMPAHPLSGVTLPAELWGADVARSAVGEAGHQQELQPFREFIDACERKYFQQGLGLVAGVVSRLAKLAQLDRSTVHRKLKEHGLLGRG